MSSTDTHCPYCALQCGMTLSPHADAAREEWEVSPRDFPTNRGGLCRKGWTSAELLSHPERLTSPLLRLYKNAELAPVSWDEALDFIANKIKSVQNAHGNDGVAVFGGGGLTNEKAYLLGKFARVALRTPHIDYNGRYCMASAATAAQMAFGLDRGLPFPLEDIAQSDCVLLVGSNVAETMPPVMQWFEPVRELGGLIVCDPRRTATAGNSLHLQLVPGSDSALANGLLHILLRDKLINEVFIRERTTNFEECRRVAREYWPHRVEQLTGVPEARLERAARMLGEAKHPMVLTARGAEQQSQGTHNALAFINLALAIGAFAKGGTSAASGGYGTLTGQGNGQGGREHGQKCDQLPGYRHINNRADREHMARVWNVPESELPGKGLTAVELLDALGTPTGPRALLCMGSNLVVSSPDSNRVTQQLRGLELLVVADLFLSETAQLADVVLPTTQWAEEDGTMTNLEGRVLRRKQAKNPPRGIKTDLQILTELAQKLGRGQGFSSDARVVFDELRRATEGAKADYSGISYERIEAEQGVFWPCPTTELNPQGTLRPFAQRFYHPDGRAKFHAVRHEAPGEEPDSEFPLWLTTGRAMAQYQSGTQTRRVKTLSDMTPRAYVEVHSQTAKRLKLQNGDDAQVVTRRGRALLQVKITPGIRPDVLFVPFHWGGDGCANLLTNPVLDPLSKMPEFKVCAAKLEPAEIEHGRFAHTDSTRISTDQSVFIRVESV